mgnify:CR=1 FL=1
MAHPRQFTNHLLELLDDQMLDKDTVIFALLGYLSDAQVLDMMEANEFIEPYEEDEDEDEDDEDYDEDYDEVDAAPNVTTF